MALQNRVLPTGEIVTLPVRGLFTGNRGILHRPDNTLGTSRWTHKHWIVCTLTHPRDVHHGPMPDRGWTALFFLDEAVALTAGHRPCHYCRRAAYHAYAKAWAVGTGETPLAGDIDNTLHPARVTRKRAQVRHDAPLVTLPDFAFALIDGTAHLVHGDQTYPFCPDGYDPPCPRQDTLVTVLTPRPTLDVLAAGYRPAVHPSAGL